LITGMMLSDGSLRIHGKDAYLQIGQKDKEFVYHLSNLFAKIGIVGAPPIECKSIIKPSGNLRISYLLTTFTMPYLTELHSECYRKVEGKNVKHDDEQEQHGYGPYVYDEESTARTGFCEVTTKIEEATATKGSDSIATEALAIRIERKKAAAVETKLRDRHRCDYHIPIIRFGADAREFEGWLGLLEVDPRYSKIPAPLGGHTARYSRTMTATAFEKSSSKLSGRYSHCWQKPATPALIKGPQAAQHPLGLLKSLPRTFLVLHSRSLQIARFLRVAQALHLLVRRAFITTTFLLISQSNVGPTLYAIGGGMKGTVSLVLVLDELVGPLLGI
ncbi:203_t:CDS:2, partial [Entrophospora sp. SA101]